MHEMPLLKRSAKVKDLSETSVAIEYLGEEVLLEGAGAGLFKKMYPLLDGKKCLEQIGCEIEEPLARVQDLLQSLSGAGVVAFLGRTERSMTGLEFYELHRRFVPHWLRPVYEHPLWDKITSGKASLAQVLGFAFEKYHYIEGAHEHMGIAAANATPEMMPHLARHFIEEYTHGDIYRKGLQSHFSDAMILQSQPLPSTRALVNFLSETAARNSFSYYAGNEVLQMTENTKDEGAASSIDDFYSAMRKHYPSVDRVIDSFIAHTNLDQSLDHENVFKEMCEGIPVLSAAEVKDAMNVARSMAEHLLLFMDGIDVWYGTHGTVPRLPCTLLSE